MSRNLHFAEKYEVKYAPVSAFDWALDGISTLLDEFDCEICGAESGDADEFEVSREDIVRLVSELRNRTEREICGMQVEDLICFFETAAAGSDQNCEYVHFSWF